MHAIYDLHYDFHRRNGWELIIRKEEGLAAEAISPLQRKMLQLYRIPHLLPVTVEEKDLRVTLHYSLSERRMLQHWIKGQKLSIEQFYRLLYQIVSILEDSKNYMLQEEGFILDERLIFIGKRVEEVYLTYLPLKEPPQGKALREEMFALLTRLIGSVEKLPGDGLQELLQYCRVEDFHLKGLKQRIQDRMRENPSIQSSPVETNERPADPPPEEESERETETKKDTDSPGRLYTIFGAISALSLAGIWRFYLANPAEPVLFVSVALSILIVNASVMVGWYMRKRKAKGKQGLRASKKEDRTLAERTTLLQNRQAKRDPQTVLLKESGQPLAKAFLLKEEAGDEETIVLDRDRLVIGRNEEQADYVIDHQAVGRAHLEVLRVGTTFLAKDLGSINGTRLNGDRLIPDKTYELSPDDTITLAGLTFVFQSAKETKA